MEEKNARDNEAAMKRYTKIEKQTDNRFLNLYHMDAVSKDGAPFDYYFASRNPEDRIKARTHENEPEGIAIYAVRKDNPGQLVMLRQYRYPIGDYLYEIPAGLVDKGETPAQSGIREMKEETGLTLEIYEGGEDYFRRPFFMAQGLTDESSTMVYGYAEGEPGGAAPEASEDIEVLFVDRRQAREILAKERVSLRAAFMLMHFIHSQDEYPFAFLE